MEQARERNYTHKDGFIYRLPNRRTEAWKHPESGDWFIWFYRFSNNIVPEEQIGRFEQITYRMGGCYTVAFIRLSEESMFGLVQNYLWHDLSNSTSL